MKSRKIVFHIALICFFCVFLTAQKEECNYDPPFDATGEYEGGWWVGEGDQCPVTAEIQMNAVTALVPLWDATAHFSIDFSCIDWPEELPPLLPMELDAIGVMDDNGTLTFTALGCTIALCVFFDSTGTGVDADGDGFMDSYTGTWDFAILIAGFAPLGISGEFELLSAPAADDDDDAAATMSFVDF